MHKDKLKNVSNREIKDILKTSENVLEAAKKLGVSRTALYVEIKKRGYRVSSTIVRVVN